MKRYFSKRSFLVPFIQPDVVLIIPAYNEEEFIFSKIKNTLELDYPLQHLRVIFITDGSTDKTPEIIKKFPVFTLIHQTVRKGKSAAINEVMANITEDIVIFCDANTLLNKECITLIVQHYQDPRVGGVAGEKKIFSTADTTVSTGEGLYWKYESFMKKLDSALYTVVGAAGELLSIRTRLYQPMPENIIIDDFVLSLRICLKGYVIRYEPAAYSIETSSISMKEEQERKIRISAGAFQAMALLKPLFNFLKHPVLTFQYISHRVLRWTLCPVCLVLVFISNFTLAAHSGAYFYQCLFLLQLLFYFFTITGWVLVIKNKKNMLLYVPYYFIFMNVSVVIGFYRYVTKNQSVLWKKATRQS